MGLLVDAGVIFAGCVLITILFTGVVEGRVMSNQKKVLLAVVLIAMIAYVLLTGMSGFVFGGLLLLSALILYYTAGLGSDDAEFAAFIMGIVGGLVLVISIIMWF